MDFDALSQREREVLELALAGLSARDIADRLTLTEATIRSHLARIYAKSGVSGRVELMAKVRPGTAPEPEAPVDGPAEQAESAPRRAGRRRKVVIGTGAIVLALIGIAALVMFLQPGPPPKTTLPNLGEMLAAQKVQTLVLQDDTLFVTTTDGRRYSVDGVQEQLPEGVWGWVQAVDPQAMEKVTFTVRKPDTGPDWTMIMVVLSTIVSLIVVAFVAILGLAILRWILRSTPPRRRV